MFGYVIRATAAGIQASDVRQHLQGKRSKIQHVMPRHFIVGYWAFRSLRSTLMVRRGTRHTPETMSIQDEPDLRGP